MVSQIREMMAKECETIWVDTSQMLADVLTKLGCERELILQALSSGVWKLAPTDDALEKKAAIRAGRQNRKQQKKGIQLSPEDG